MTLVPLYGFVEGDTIGVLVLATNDMPLRDVAEKLRHSASARVPTAGVQWELFAGERVLDPATTVDGGGLGPLQRIDLRRRRAQGDTP